ncbi:MAG: ribonuclease HI [Spirochaetales bacterium]|nr:ribonuclease HI [Spirochaetales bacterium]MCF7937331.1 ribonuclease HI [Spirochaetales bacterium]
MLKTPQIEIYTDGGCWGNPGPGGWAYVLILEGEVIENAGAEKQTTNNRMELTAVIRALEYVRDRTEIDGFPIRLHTDSQYVQKGISEWIHSWIKRGWKTASKQPVKNREYWQRLHALSSNFTIEWVWVRGHAGNEWNERCDELVQEAIGRLE